MGGRPCVIIIEGNGLQGDAAQLAKTAEASCQVVDYLQNDEDITFSEADAQPILDFHLRARKTVDQLNKELDKINRDLARKYNRNYGE